MFIKKFRRNPDTISTQIVGKAISVLIGLIFTIWNVIFFSNTLYQYSLFSTWRNCLFSPEKKQKLLSDIYCIDIDLESQTQIQSINKLIALAINELSDYARQFPNKKIVTGIDFIFMYDEKSENNLSDLLKSIKNMPTNMFIVFGGILLDQTDTLSYFQSRFYKEKIFNVLSNEKSDVINRLFLGNIHYIEATLHSELKGDKDIKTAIGYIPIVTWGKIIQKHFFSFPLTMFVVGEIMEKRNKGYDLYTDFVDGSINAINKNTFIAKLKKITKKTEKELSDQFYYDFFTNRDITAFKSNYIWLYRISKVFSKTPGINAYIKKNNNVVDYFFITSINKLPFFKEIGIKDNRIYTLVSRKNPYTYENESVSSVMAHIIALSNLKNSFYQTEVLWIKLLFISIFFSLTCIFSWIIEFNKCLIFIFSCILLSIFISFFLFYFGIFIEIRSTLVLCLIIFSLIICIRWIYTKNNELTSEIKERRKFRLIKRICRKKQRFLNRTKIIPKRSLRRKR